MRRRDLIAASAALPAVAVATSVRASEKARPAGATVNMTGVGLPVISGGRVRNYVFVSLRLHLAGLATPESIRRKEPFLRDALIRTGHRTPFVVADDWNRIDAAAVAASLMRSSATIAGRGAVTRVEIVSQAPRRQAAAGAR